MEIVSEELESRQVKLTIVVPHDRLMAAREVAAGEMSQGKKVPGYRPGKAPYDKMVAIVGAEAIDERAMVVAARDAVEAAVKAEGIRPSAPFGMEIIRKDPLTVTTTIPLQPSVELGDYRSISVPTLDPIEVHDEDVEAAIEAWREELSYLAPVDRPAEAGDVMTLQLVGRLDDRIVFEDESLSLALDPEKAADVGLPAAVTDELIGLAAGGSIEFELTYPEYWKQPELQGRKVAFEATVSTVAAIALPDMDDGLAEQLADVDTLDELRDRVRRTMITRARMTQRDEHVGVAVDTLVAAATIEYPPAMLEAEVIEILDDLRKRVEQQGFLWERWVELQKEHHGEIVSQAEAEAKRRIDRRLVLSRFGELERISVSRQEIDEGIAEFKARLSPAARRGLPGKNELRRDIGTQMLTGRVLDHLLAIVTGAADAADEANRTSHGAGESADPNDDPALDAQNPVETTTIPEAQDE